MESFEEKMNAILGNPDMMAQIMSMAQAIGGEAAPQAPPADPPFSIPDLDPGMLQKLAGFLGQSKIDSHQQLLLKALAPYISQGRISKLEKAMRAAKLASLASTLLTSVGLGG